MRDRELTHIEVAFATNNREVFVVGASVYFYLRIMCVRACLEL